MTVRIARVGMHHYEEPCLSGSHGSGAIFFTGCDMRCKFCQNFEISRGGKGLNVDDETLIKLMKYLEDSGAHNINLVSPSIWIKKLIPILKLAKQTVKVPIVWNSSGYESVESIEALDGLVDIYLPDFKYGDDELAKEYSGVAGYFERASAAIARMRRQQPTDVFDGDGIMQRGVIVRHLVLPSAMENSRTVLKRISEIDDTLYVSLMGQYFPTKAVREHPALGRRVSEEEYDALTEYFFEVGLKNGFAQSLDSATEDYVPYFDINALKELVDSLK